MNEVLRQLLPHSSYLNSNKNYLQSLLWSYNEYYILRFKDLLEIGDIRNFKKQDIRDVYQSIKHKIFFNEFINAYKEKVLGLLKDDISIVLKNYPVFVLKTSKGYSILEGRHRV